jgi:hypothetical protein
MTWNMRIRAAISLRFWTFPDAGKGSCLHSGKGTIRQQSKHIGEKKEFLAGHLSNANTEAKNACEATAGNDCIPL